MTQIEHPDIAKFATIRTDYAAIVDRDHCAAMLLSILEGWTNWLKERGRSLWVDMSGNELSEAVSGLFCRKTFMKAGESLEKLGLLVRKQKKACDRTYQYLLQVGALQERLNLLVFWNAACKYFQLLVSAPTAQWLELGMARLETLPGANVQPRTMQNPNATPCNVPAGTTLKDIDNHLSNNTTNNKPVVVSSGEKVVLEDRTIEQPGVVKSCEKVETVTSYPSEDQSVTDNWSSTAEIESPEQTEHLEPVDLPQQQKLESNRVNVQDKGLQTIAHKYKDRLATAVAAWLEWAARTSVEKPTRSLAQAIKEDWRPESKVLSPQEKAAAVVEETDWTTHPQWESWLLQMRQGLPKFVVFGTCFDRQMRRAIAEWANERKLIWEPIGVR